MELTGLPRLKLGNIVLEEALQMLYKNSPFYSIKSLFQASQNKY